MDDAAAPVRLEVLDRCCQAGRASNEDAIGATPSAAWAIDGTKGPFDHTLTPGPTDAAWYAQTPSAVLLESYADAVIDPMAALIRAAEKLSAAYARNAAGAPAHGQPSACLALVASGAARTLHLFNIGDCRIAVEQAGAVTLFGSSGIEPLERDAIAELVRLREAGGDPWPQLRATLRRNFEIAMNQPGGYWVVHPSLQWLHAVQQAALPAHQVDHVLLASDGFFRLVSLFGAYDAGGLVAAARRNGLAALYAELRAREADDPACRLHPRLKPMDDASAILVRIVG